MKEIATFVFIILASLTPAHSGFFSQTPPADRAGELIRMLDEIGAKNIWPGFNPAIWPLALYDGEKTVLIRHPNPPADFKPLPGRPGVLTFPGRFPAVVGNSTCEIGGVRTATLIATSNVERALRGGIEEVFHVFWLARHTGFRPDEMVRYGYPLTDGENLRALLSDREAIARALTAEGEAEAAGWAAASIKLHRERAARLERDLGAFETDLEMMEGTANFAADFAFGETPALTASILRMARPVEDIRYWFYYTGAGVCWLLDRFLPDWKARIEADVNLTTRALLASELARRGVGPLEFTAAETAGFKSQAEKGIADLADRRARLRKELADRPGARIVIEVADGAAPLNLQRFDPLNLFVLDNGEVAQANFITLAGPSGSVELTNPGFQRSSFAGTIGLTEPAGPHPLGLGLRRLTIPGIQGEPRIERKDGAVVVEAPGVRASFKGATARTEGGTITVLLPKK